MKAEKTIVYRITAVVLLLAFALLATPAVRADNYVTENELNKSIGGLQENVQSVENALGSIQDEIENISNAVSDLKSGTEGNGGAPTGSRDLAVYVGVRDDDGIQWTPVNAKSWFARSSITANPGENMYIIAVDPETEEFIPSGSGVLTMKKSMWAEGGQKWFAPGGTGGPKLPSWLSGGEQNRASYMLSKLSEGIKFTRKGGIMVPIIEGFPNRMTATVTAPGYESVTFGFKIGKGKPSGGGVSTVRTTPTPLKPGKVATVKAVNDQGSVVDGVNVVIDGTKFGNPANIVVPEGEKQMAVEVSEGGETVWPSNPPMILTVGATGGSGGGGGGGGTPQTIYIVAIAGVLLFAYTAWRLDWISKARSKFGGSREEKHL